MSKVSSQEREAIGNFSVSPSTFYIYIFENLTNLKVSYTKFSTSEPLSAVKSFRIHS